MKRWLPNVFLFFISTSVIFISLATTAALAGEKVDQTLEFIEGGKVSISNVNGEIKVSGWNKQEVRVVGELSDRNKEFTFKRNNSRMLIEMLDKSGWGGKGDDLEIFVPIMSEIEFESPNSKFTLDTIKGKIDLDAVNGNIEVNDIEGRVKIEVVNGNIVCKDIDGDIDLETVNGNIIASAIKSEHGEFEAVNGNIEVEGHIVDFSAETVSGNIKARIKNLNTMEVESVSGNAELELGFSGEPELHVNTVSGGVNVFFLNEPSAHFDITTHTGGNISNALSDDKAQKAQYGPSRSLNFSHKGGKGKVAISTLHGDVVIKNK